jgi:hypothetical protein
LLISRGSLCRFVVNDYKAVALPVKARKNRRRAAGVGGLERYGIAILAVVIRNSAHCDNLLNQFQRRNVANLTSVVDYELAHLSPLIDASATAAPRKRRKYTQSQARA